MRFGDSYKPASAHGLSCSRGAGETWVEGCPTVGAGARSPSGRAVAPSFIVFIVLLAFLPVAAFVKIIWSSLQL